jgi:cytochrome c peroxidase
MRLARRHWIYTEPGPVKVDLTQPGLPQPRLTPRTKTDEFLDVPAYTDFKLHDITDPADPLAADPFDMNQPPGSAAFEAGNRRFLTARLWGAANQSPYFHHGQFTTMRQAILAHAGEALGQRQAFQALANSDQDAVIEFLKSLQVLPPSTPALVVDEHGRAKRWPR